MARVSKNVVSIPLSITDIRDVDLHSAGEVKHGAIFDDIEQLARLADMRIIF